MAFGAASYGLSLAAGSLSTLSPCVLPIVPILLTTAVAAHRLGPFALAAGLTLSFTTVGVLFAGVGAAIGLDSSMLRMAAAILMMSFGLVLVSSQLQMRLAGAVGGISGAGHHLLEKISLTGLGGQFAIGLVLGLAWSPCVGPTLGAAVTLASQGQDLGQVALMMAAFGIGAGLPLIVLGSISRQAMLRMRGKLLAVGDVGKRVLGSLMLLLGVMILTGGDKAFEAWTLLHAPDWLVSLTTSI